MTNELSNSKTPTKRRAWPAKRRQNQAAAIRRAQPWKKSTGPRSAAGKTSSAQNAHKHGLRSRDITALRRALNAQKKFVRDALSGEF
jgi:hypothetical protein